MIKPDTYQVKLPAPKDVVEIAISTVPKAIQSVRFSARCGYVQAFQPKSNKDWKLAVKTAVYEQLPAGWEKFVEVPLWVQVWYVFPPLKSMKKADRECLENGGIIPKQTKPDVNDNLNKGLYDALTGVLWDDDARVAHSESDKFFGKEPGIIIRVGSLPERIENERQDEGN